MIGLQTWYQTIKNLHLYGVYVYGYIYTLGHIHFGNSVAHVFRRFLRQLRTDFLEI